MIDIVCNIDNKYVEHCGVMLSSLFVNNHSCSFRIHVINSGVHDEAKARLTSFATKFNAIVFFYDVDFSKVRDFPITKKDHLSLAAYLRLFMSEVLPNDIDKILYLDCDLLVVDSVEELWETDIENVAIAVVEERSPFDTESPVILGYPVGYSYFNSGVMLVNLKYWREHNLFSRFIEFISLNSEIIILHDQDVLNAILYNARKFVSIRWNLMDFFLFAQPDVQSIRMSDLQSSMRHPAIVHFTGKRKPWLRNCDSPFRNQYVELAGKHGWHVITLRESVCYYLRKTWYHVLILLHLKPKRTISLRTYL